MGSIAAAAAGAIQSCFGQKGKQNIDNEYVEEVKRNQPDDHCRYLRILYRATTDKAKRRKIKQAMKRYNCDGKDRYR